MEYASLVLASHQWHLYVHLLGDCSMIPDRCLVVLGRRGGRCQTFCTAPPVCKSFFGEHQSAGLQLDNMTTCQTKGSPPGNYAHLAHIHVCFERCSACQNSPLPVLLPLMPQRCSSRSTIYDLSNNESFFPPHFDNFVAQLLVRASCPSPLRE